MGPQLERLARQKKNFRVITVDIDEWRSPVATQYGIQRLPTLWLYEGKERRASDKTAREIYAFLRRS